MGDAKTLESPWKSAHIDVYRIRDVRDPELPQGFPTDRTAPHNCRLSKRL